jgi:hypothetical protein
MLPKDNPESWQQIHEFIASYPDNAVWQDWKQIAREIISALESLELVSKFRIGQSMSHIIFSTLNNHRVFGEPHVTLSIHAKQKTVRVAYSRTNLHFNSSISEDTYPVATAIPGILNYLRRLWNETKPESLIPDSLKVI